MTAAAAYEDSAAHVRDELRRLDVMLRSYLEEWWAEGGGGDEFGGLYISDAEVDRLLDVTGGTGGGARASRNGRGGSLRDRLEAVTREIRARERATRAGGGDLRLPSLAERFGLDPRGRDALLLALAPELDRKYETVYAYLQDDITRTRPTVGLLLRVLCSTTAERLAAREAFAAGSPLVRAGLVHLTGEPGSPLPSRVVGADERVVDYLLGGDAVAAELRDTVTVIDPDRSLDDLDLDLDGRDRERLAALADPDGPAAPVAYVHGPYGSAKGAAVEAVCDARGIGLLRADARELGVPADDRRERDGRRPAERGPLDALVREARLRDAAVHVTGAVRATADADGADRDATEAVAGLIDDLAAYDGPVFVSGEEPVSPRLGARIDGRPVTTLSFEVPDYERRRELWAAVDALPPDVDPADLAGKFRLTAGGIEDAVATARTIAGGGRPSAADVYAACRAQSRERLGSLATAVETGYAWEDIVLPPDTMAHLREVAAHVEHRGRVYSDWGFGAKYSLGNGLNVLFTGPSGTGKTMAAEIVAGEAGLDLYRIDLAGVVSKYIGETEENLRAVFDEAEGSDAVLFFDEADALFGQRSEVSDSHDRYANVEVSYLLQRMEDHDGTVILASNLEENIDDAFLRRINLSVEFPFPDREARAEIWRNVFPEATPLADLDVEFLSGFDLAGGNIKNAALTAAFLAAEDDAPVGMNHLVRALRRELRKTGRLVDPADFGEYRTLLET